MHTLLALDTCGPSLSVALAQGGKIVFEATCQNGLTHSQSLMPLVEQALAAGGLDCSQLDALAAVHGPGSFTGVRIGVETVRALAHAAGKPCFAVSVLETLAMGISLFPGTLCALQDARAGQVYASAFRTGDTGLPEPVLPEEAVALETFLAHLPEGPCCFAGDGAVAHRSRIREALGARAAFAPANLMAPRASCAALLALSRPERAMPWERLLPYYLRLPQAERERMAREAERHG